MVSASGSVEGLPLGVQTLDVPSGGPGLDALAAAVDVTRHPLLLAGGAESSSLGQWRMLAFDPVELIEHRVGGAREQEPARRGIPRLMHAMGRAFGAPDPARAAAQRDDPRLPPFRGGAMGLLGFDLGRELERLPDRLPRDTDLPDLFMGLYPFVLAEHVASGRRVISGRGTDAQAAAFRRAVEALADRARDPKEILPGQAGAPTSTFEREAYEQAVARVVEHIRAGDIYQVNLSQRFELGYSGTPAALHHALCARSPTPFGSVLRTPAWSLVSNSPELFLRRRGARIESRPIKGTRPRGCDQPTDDRLRHELETSAKEHAELAMIVDLVRNDLSRPAVLGSIDVDLPFETEAWATVFHRVATVHGRLPEDVDVAKVVEAAFPPASVTGTPKIRALEIVEALEPVRRHAYTGALGWFDADGDFDLSVNIRIATQVGERLLLPVGGGITVRSEPAAEYVETWHKARAMFEALRAPLPPGCFDP